MIKRIVVAVMSPSKPPTTTCSKMQESLLCVAKKFHTLKCINKSVEAKPEGGCDLEVRAMACFQKEDAQQEVQLQFDSEPEYEPD